MIITSQGFGHFEKKVNNQDFGIESPRMVLILDGCSGAKYSEVGTRLFAQLFSRKEEWDSAEKFEDNVKEVFEDIILMMSKYYKTPEEMEESFITENLLFTIIACFDMGDKYVVKLFGDGYIITQNVRERTSYMRFAYGKCPPYFAYRYCKNLKDPRFSDYTFKTFTFDKAVFPNIAIATDGIQPIAKGEVKMMDGRIFEGNQAYVDIIIKGKKQKFYDDITIGIIGGESK